MLFGCAASPRVAPGEARVLFTFRKLNLRNTIFSKKNAVVLVTCYQ